eukprot:m.66955 g.66955  ORF g.66955 m.66955 type:complete len:605 (+) comp35420_c0_seq4:690-2504(+)
MDFKVSARSAHHIVAAAADDLDELRLPDHDFLGRPTECKFTVTLRFASDDEFSFADWQTSVKEVEWCHEVVRYDEKSPGQCRVPSSHYRIQPVNVSTNGEYHERQFNFRVSGCPGSYQIRFFLRCARHQHCIERCSLCWLANAVPSDAASSLVKVKQPVVSGCRQIVNSLCPDFVKLRQYPMIVKHLQRLEYNGDWNQLSQDADHMLHATNSVALRIVIQLELASGLLYKGKSNIPAAEQLIGLSIEMAELCPVMDGKVLKARSYYILSGIKRHQRDLCSALKCIENSKELLFGVKLGEDTATCCFNEASVFLEGEEKNFQLANQLLSIAINTGEEYDSSLGVIPQRSHIKSACLYLGSYNFDVNDGLPVCHHALHRRLADGTKDHLLAIDENALDPRYQAQYLIPLCDFYLAKNDHKRAISIAEKAFHVADRHGYVREQLSAEKRIAYVCKMQLSVSPMGAAPDVGMGLPCKKYDAYISYHPETSDWIKHSLIPILSGARITYCTHHRHCKNYFNLYDKISTALMESRYVIVVMSPGYFRDIICEVEKILSHFSSMKQIAVLIPVRLPSLLASDLPMDLASLFYLDAEDDEFKFNLLKHLRPK